MKTLFFKTATHSEEQPTQLDYEPRANSLVIHLTNGSYYKFSTCGKTEYEWFHSGPFNDNPYYILHCFLIRDYPWQLYDRTGSLIDKGPKLSRFTDEAQP